MEKHEIEAITSADRDRLRDVGPQGGGNSGTSRYGATPWDVEGP